MYDYNKVIAERAVRVSMFHKAYTNVVVITHNVVIMWEDNAFFSKRVFQ